MARHPQRARLAGQPLAQGIRRPRLGCSREVHFRHRMGAGWWPAHRALWREHAGPGAHQVWQRGTKKMLAAAHPDRRGKVDMQSPGVELRPIRTLDGDKEVNEVFFTDVKVPVENLVGEENKGWTYAKYLLTYERTGIAGVGFCIAALAKLKVVAAKVMKNGQPLDQDPLFAARMAQVEIDLENMKTTNLRVIAAVAGGGVPGAESSMLKIRGTEIRQEILSLIRRAVGPYALPFIEEAQYEGYADEPV